MYKPLPAFYTDPQWSHITDWRDELAPYYDQAERMLGATTNTRVTAGDEDLRAVADDMGVGDTWHPATVGVFLGSPGKTVPDPFFGGAGPDRTGCVHCGQCMTGCPHNAKNTLETNYLHLAERAGAVIHPFTTVTAVTPVGPVPGGGYRVETVHTGHHRRRRTLTAEQVVFAAASLGTQRLLHTLRASGRLPGISPRLGELTRTNSEAVLVASTGISSRADFAGGVAITSSIHPDPDTHVEICHYGKGANAMFALTTPLVDGDRLRWLRWLGQNLRHPLAFLRSFDVRRASERSCILLTMQAVDNSLTTYLKNGVLGPRMTTRQGHGSPNPTWIPAAHEVVRRYARRIGGIPLGTVNDVVNVPVTAHLIGGCPIGDTPENGVIDAYQRLYGHPGLHVVDGSAVTANLGVNPALTITAQAERAMAYWPNRGQPDPRPPLGEPYRPVRPVRPRHPAVPGSAPGALRIPDSGRPNG